MNVQAILQKHKLRKTPIRVQVLGVFSGKEEAISHSELEKELVDTDRVTLYRTLKTFEESGIIHNVMDGTGVTRYALCQGTCEHDHHQDNHAHFNCLTCGKTVCLEGVVIPHLDLPEGFQQESSHLIIKGNCELCTS